MAGTAAACGLSRAWSAELEIIARVNGEPVARGEVQRLLAAKKQKVVQAWLVEQEKQAKIEVFP